MSTILFVCAIICVLTAIVMLVFKPYDYGKSVTHFNKIGSSADTTDTSSETRWRSVRIRPGLMTCASANAISDQVFLSRDAPPLPLEGCGEKDCNCHYIFLDDRRSGSERRIDLGLLVELFPDDGGERRQLRGRRLADLAA
jgi:hypothetical protein